jgi:hypothetical protein
MTQQPIKVDLNLITRRELNRFRQDRKALPDSADKDVFDFENLSSKVIASWPYGPVTSDVYLELGAVDAAAVDLAVSEALEQLGKKK